MLKLIFMAKSPDAAYLHGNCQLHSRISYDKKSRVSLSVVTQNFETKTFRIHLWKKCISYNFMLWKNAFFFIHLLLLYENCLMSIFVNPGG